MLNGWPVWVKVIFRSGQLWLQVVGSAGGRAGTILDGLRALLTVSVRESLLSDARGGVGDRTCTLTDASLVTIYDCDVFSSFFHLYNPYEPSESEKKLIVTDSLTQKGGISSLPCHAALSGRFPWQLKACSSVEVQLKASTEIKHGQT